MKVSPLNVKTFDNAFLPKLTINELNNLFQGIKNELNDNNLSVVVITSIHHASISIFSKTTNDLLVKVVSSQSFEYPYTRFYYNNESEETSAILYFLAERRFFSTLIENTFKGGSN